MMMMMMMMMMIMMNCFCGMIDQQKAFSLISSPDHCQRSSPSQISHMQQAGFEPAQNLSWMKLCSSNNHYTTASIPSQFLVQSNDINWTGVFFVIDIEQVFVPWGIFKNQLIQHSRILKEKYSPVPSWKNSWLFVCSKKLKNPAKDVAL